MSTQHRKELAPSDVFRCSRFFFVFFLFFLIFFCFFFVFFCFFLFFFVFFCFFFLFFFLFFLPFVFDPSKKKPDEEKGKENGAKLTMK